MLRRTCAQKIATPPFLITPLPSLNPFLNFCLLGLGSNLQVKRGRVLYCDLLSDLFVARTREGMRSVCGCLSAEMSWQGGETEVLCTHSMVCTLPPLEAISGSLTHTANT